MPQAVQDKLRTWVKHARAWHKSAGPSWAREEHARGAEWVCSTGQRLKEVSVPGLEPKAEDAVAAPLQREGTDASSRVASRVGGSEAERRRKAMMEIAASRAGKKRPAEGAAASPAPTPVGSGADVKRSRGEGDESEAREARERKQAEKAARRAEKEQEHAARHARKAAKAEAKAEAKAARRAAKAARREARASGVPGGGAEGHGEEEEEEEEESEEESEESEEEGDDSEQVFEDTMAKCDKVATKMRSALSSIIDKKEAGMGQPAIMTRHMSMAPHQLVGLSWLHGLHRQKASGILADEMGLGKTVQAIALLAQLLSEGDAGPHLVVAPTSTLTNWQREFEMWCPALRVLKYHGSEAERAAMRGDLLRGGFHVVLCTFKLWEQDSDKAKAERALFKKLQLSYLVLDEAQQIKNSESRRYKNLTAVRSAHRLLLTGTPIENSPRELLSLLAFLMPSTFASSSGALARRTRARTRTRTRTPGPEPNRPIPEPIPTPRP